MEHKASIDIYDIILWDLFEMWFGKVKRHMNIQDLA